MLYSVFATAEGIDSGGPNRSVAGGRVGKQTEGEEEDEHGQYS